MCSIEKDVVKNLFAIGFLEKRKCSKCLIDLKVRSRKRNKDGDHTFLSFRCTGCASFSSLYSGTMLATNRKPINEVIEMIKCWSAELTIAKTCDFLTMQGIEVSRQTVGKLWTTLRHVCTLMLDKPNIKLGGYGQVVEIDESLFARVKHNKGKDLKRKHIWVFGLVDRSTSKVYFQIVPNRKAETLLSIIYDHVQPGTLIYSDCWSAYNKISYLHQNQIKHQTVNHSCNFVCPQTMACTNTIESLWNTAKIKFKEMRGCNRLYIQSYLDEFMWRHNYKINRKQAIEQILIDSVIVYKKISESLIQAEIIRVNGPDEDIEGESVDAIVDEVIDEKLEDIDIPLFNNYFVDPEIEALFEDNIEPKSQNIEPKSQNIEPKSQNIEPKSQNIEPLQITLNQSIEKINHSLAKMDVSESRALILTAEKLAFMPIDHSSEAKAEVKLVLNTEKTKEPAKKRGRKKNSEKLKDNGPNESPKKEYMLRPRK